MTAMKSLTLLLVAGALAACAKTEMPPPVDLAAEAQAIRDRSAEWQKLAVAKDVAGITSSVFSPDAATLYDGNIRKGTAEIQAGLQGEMTAMPDSTISWTTTDVTVAASGDLAYERGAFTFDPDGAGEKPANNGEFVTVWSKADGTWRAVVDAGTAAKAPEAAAATPAGG